MTARAVAVLALLAPLLTAFEPLRSRNKEIELGNGAMHAGKAEEALKHYDAAVAKLPGDPGAHFDRGTALYALSRFDEAGQEFLRATEAKDGVLKASAFYNLGNAFFKKDKFKEAVEAYKRALALDPRDQRAKWNLEIALRKQKDQNEKDEKNKQSQKDQKQDQNKQDKQDKQDKQADKGKDQKDQKDQKQDQKQDQNKQDKQAGQDQHGKDEAPKPPPPQKADAQELEAVLDSLEHSPKDLEKERARMRAVRRAPPARDW